MEKINEKRVQQPGEKRVHEKVQYQTTKTWIENIFFQGYQNEKPENCGACKKKNKVKKHTARDSSTAAVRATVLVQRED